MLVVGDVHGKFDAYYAIVKDARSSFQIGDFCFENAWTKLFYSDLDPKIHRVGQGNHDPHYGLGDDFQHWTGRYGPIQIDDKNVFWVGGALSIDLVPRVAEWANGGPRTWFSNEQLSYQEMKDCEKKWKKLKPDIMLTHTAPESVIFNYFNKNKGKNIMDTYGWGSDYTDMTSQFLENLLSIHRPKTWIFGHFHRSWNENIDGTNFICLAELETLEI